MNSNLNKNGNNSAHSSSLSIERQESKDSGFWTMSKCSFESMKSLSINDTPSIVAVAAAAAYIAASQQQLNNQIQSSVSKESGKNTSSQLKVLNMSNNSNECNGNNKNFLDADLSKTQLSNWKKWKNGQAWRYNSSNNIYESDYPTDKTSEIENNCSDKNNNFSLNLIKQINTTGCHAQYNITNTSSNSFDNSINLNRSFDSSTPVSNSNITNEYSSENNRLVTSKRKILFLVYAE